MIIDPGSTMTSFYKHVVRGKGKSMAIIAISNKLLKAIYWILKKTGLIIQEIRLNRMTSLTQGI